MADELCCMSAQLDDTIFALQMVQTVCPALLQEVHSVGLHQVCSYSVG